MKDKLTLFPEDSRVNLTHLQDKEKEQKMTDISGRKCLEQYEKLNRAGLLAKTFMDLLIGTGDWYSRRSTLTWKLKGTKCGRLYFQLFPKTRPIEEIEFGLLPTPQAMDCMTNPPREITASGRIIINQGNNGSAPLKDLAMNGMLPTPRASESIERRNMKTIVDKVENGGDVTLTTLAKYKGGVLLPTPRVNGHGNSHQRIADGKMDDLTTLAKHGLLPTPTTRDWKGARTKEALQEAGRNATNNLPDAFSQAGKTSQLNPRFVAEMMGFPPNWTELPFQNGETKALKDTEMP